MLQVFCMTQLCTQASRLASLTRKVRQRRTGEPDPEGAESITHMFAPEHHRGYAQILLHDLANTGPDKRAQLHVNAVKWMQRALQNAFCCAEGGGHSYHGGVDCCLLM